MAQEPTKASARGLKAKTEETKVNPDDLPMRNAAVKYIQQLQAENKRLKDSIGRGRRQQSSAYSSSRYDNTPVGLQRLGSKPTLPTS